MQQREITRTTVDGALTVTGDLHVGRQIGDRTIHSVDEGMTVILVEFTDGTWVHFNYGRRVNT
ncbi:hypothetical protein ABTY98_05295 [Streptomyces sp. NPDC096040]|uniref:hypothetical protein n=1 Tax=Streptomyces sp. NPDC096040 TaxID=3155541 RepID=UPI003318571D